MLHNIVRHFHLQRRRLFLTGLLAFVAGYALYAHIGSTAMGMPFPVFVGLYYMAVVVLAAAISSYLFPRLCRLIDAIAVSRLFFAMWVVVTENHEIAASPLASATLVVGSAMILLRICAWIKALSLTPTAVVAHVSVAEGTSSFLAWLDNAAEYKANSGNLLIRANAFREYPIISAATIVIRRPSI